MMLNEFKVNNKPYKYYSIHQAGECEGLPYSYKVFLENMLRKNAPENNIRALFNRKDIEIKFYPTRVLMQDFTGVPAVVDLAAMRDAMKMLGKNPESVNPMVPVDLVIDHSVMVDKYGSLGSYEENTKLEFARNFERYEFLHWAQKSFKNFRVVPPGTGICHQVNLEHLAKVVWQQNDLLYFDSLVGTDSHTTMINGLGVLGWGVGGIEAEAVMLGQPLSMLLPEVVGVELDGELPAGATSTDLVLLITNLLRTFGVVGRFVEFYGAGLSNLSLADRATIANMCPEYGATCALFPVDEATLDYLRLTGRSEEQVQIVEQYTKLQGFWHNPEERPFYHHNIELQLDSVMPSMAGPKRPQDRILLQHVKETSKKHLQEKSFVIDADYSLSNGDVVIAAITSCTNTSNPSVMLGAGLLAKKAVEEGLHVSSWVKTSLAPGSQVVTDYLTESGLLPYLEHLGFYLVGYGCTTCIGNSGPLRDDIAKTIAQNDMSVAAVLSGNRNFEGRIHPQVKLNYLASPPLVVAYAIAGTTLIDFETEHLGINHKGNKIYLKDIWPTKEEILALQKQFVNSSMFIKRYKDVFKGNEEWQKLKSSNSVTYDWNPTSQYIKRPPYFEMPNSLEPIREARILALLGDSITTDHISPAGNIAKNSEAGLYLQQLGLEAKDFNSYGSRRGNHEVMIRGTFANIRLQNKIANKQGSFTKIFPDGEESTIYHAAMQYSKDYIPLVVIAGKEYGTGSSRDWAAKGTRLLGVRAVIAESFERIHRSNLIGMGVLPLEFLEGETSRSLSINGDEIITIDCDIADIAVGQLLEIRIDYSDNTYRNTNLKVRIDTNEELLQFLNGGVLPYVLKTINKA